MQVPAKTVPGTRLAWSTLEEWLELVDQVGRIPKSSTPHHQRCARLYNSLTLADICGCTDMEVLVRAEAVFDQARYAGGPGYYSVGRVWTRAALGEALVETRNQIARVRSGRAGAPRAKGPRFDPTMLPAAALDRLIQQHPDLTLVNLLRVERDRRLKLATSMA